VWRGAYIRLGQQVRIFQWPLVMNQTGHQFLRGLSLNQRNATLYMVLDPRIFEGVLSRVMELHNVSFFSSHFRQFFFYFEKLETSARSCSQILNTINSILFSKNHL
jgi:hypothetical protein